MSGKLGVGISISLGVGTSGKPIDCALVWALVVTGWRMGMGASLIRVG